MIRIYYILTKPGIVLGNIITTAAGFALASQGNINYFLFLITILGLSLVIASACVFNNYMDRKLDEKMARTKNRPLAKGLISGRNAIIFASVLGIAGIWVLAEYTNLLSAAIALAGFLIYVAVYTVWKYHTTYATLIGSIAGAVPPVVGYCAVSDRIDTAAVILFLILVLWQMPHFYAIAIYRLEEYKTASIPVLPLVEGMHVTKVHMMLYIVAFMMAAMMLSVFGYAGYAYVAVSAVLGASWLWLGFQGFKCSNDKKWARNMFRYSLVIITVLCITISFQ